jgi:hypothetical protein
MKLSSCSVAIQITPRFPDEACNASCDSVFSILPQSRRKGNLLALSLPPTPSLSQSWEREGVPEGRGWVRAEGESLFVNLAETWYNLWRKIQPISSPGIWRRMRNG